MFVSQEVTLPLSFAQARARLLCLTRNGALSRASGEAFVAGRGDALGYGPFGEVPGATTLVRVQYAEPAPHDGLLVLPLRWEAMWPTGRLFPVLDADITLLPLGSPPATPSAGASDETRLVVAGSYRPPSDGLGSMVSGDDVQHIAATTICSLLHKIAEALCAAPERVSSDNTVARGEAAAGGGPAPGLSAPPGLAAAADPAAAGELAAANVGVKQAHAGGAAAPLRWGVRLPYPRRGRRRPA